MPPDHPSSALYWPMPDSPILSASETARLMGFSTSAALAKARLAGRLPIEMFQLPGRRGWFASTQQVREWLEASLKGVQQMGARDAAQAVLPSESS